ncbi:MAG: hypothetical protein M4579_004284 [Chaenotheca gracillima]|nr:MAG: hypothetical protein M4579_004284 [Chaenotheca gracillima]
MARRPPVLGESAMRGWTNGPAPKRLRVFADAIENDSVSQNPAEPPPKRRRLSPESPSDNDLQVEDDEGHITISRRDLEISFFDSLVREPSDDSLWGIYGSQLIKFESLVWVARTEFHVAISSVDHELIFESDFTSHDLDDTLRRHGYYLQGNKAFERENLVSRMGPICRQALLRVPQGGMSGHIRLNLGLKHETAISHMDISPKPSEHLEKMIAEAFPEGSENNSGSWSPQLFYGSVHVSTQERMFPPSTDADLLSCKLYPFQQRAVRWLLRREHVDLDDDGQISAYKSTPEEVPSFRAAQDADGKACHVSHLYNCVATDLSGFRRQFNGISGGILAEEMGLGKTVELIALICLHKCDRPLGDPIIDPYSNNTVQPSAATLIITPGAILQQWRSELATHAPSLRVMHYEGLNRGPARRKETEELVAELLDCDIVLATYATLASEIHYAGPRPDRSLRNTKKYEPRKSPLVQISWWRVCLDGTHDIRWLSVTQLMKLQRLKWSRVATPVRKDATDLLGLLVFLRYEPFCRAPWVWDRLVRQYQDTFKSIFSQIALRHTKDQVRSELTLPPQKRVVITIPFTQIEEQHYSQMFQQMCEDCGLDVDGAPAIEGWNPKDSELVEKMRMWLTRLRQTCLHPEVGHRNRRALGNAGGMLRSVDEVLEVMIEQNETQMRIEERNYLNSQIRRGQILESRHKSREALAIWSGVLEESENIVKECRVQLEQEIASVARSKAATDGPEAKDEPRLSPKVLEVPDPVKVDESSDETGDESDRQESKGKIGSCRSRLRSALELEHIVTFFIANAKFQIKSNEDLTKPESDEFKKLETEETEGYEKAKSIRRELLSESLKRVQRLMRHLSRKAETQTFVEIPEIAASTQPGGIESRKLIEKAELLGTALNDQANQLDEWRETMVQLLLMPLVDEDEGVEIQGDEYETSTKQQDEVYVYMEALRAVVADRHGALTGEVNLLIQEDMESALKQAKRGDGHHPELLQSLLAIRESIKPTGDLGSFRETIASLRSSTASLRNQEKDGSHRARMELSIIEKQLKSLQAMFGEQMKAVTGIGREIETFRQTMNLRLEYYRQLQQISDTVAPYEDEAETDNDDSMNRMLEKEKKSAATAASLKSKRRYLLHLRLESSDKAAERICIICRMSFDVGALTVCGHQYCRECIQLWWRQHRTCPVCKKRLVQNDLHQITYKPQELQVQEESGSSHNDEAPKQSESSIYSGINSGTLNEIKNVDIEGSFGTKIDTLAQHLLWLRVHDPGAKSIVFSQYREFLEVLGKAFKHFKINFVSIDSGGSIERFKHDPSVECFLLHAKAHSSGLNLVNATHVFLCEPLINTALELQAIARVHRIGQHRATTVWMYLVNDTVEESIYDISVNRRLAHMGGESGTRSGVITPTLKESMLDAANSLELQEAPIGRLLTKGQKDGEMVKSEDLWNCLFRKGRPRNGQAQTAQLDPEVARNLRANAAEARRV